MTLGASESESEAGIAVFSLAQAESQYLVRVETLSPLPHPAPHACLEHVQKITKQKEKRLPSRQRPRTPSESTPNPALNPVVPVSG